MQLEFDIDLVRGHWRVNVWHKNIYMETENLRMYLTEAQYQKITEWGKVIFNTSNPLHSKRFRRMAYADFWFRSKKDADWFVLYWSGVDSNSF